jgi:hypothetical protein
MMQTKHTERQWNKAEPIDAVIAWVDGNDPRLNGKRNSFINGTVNPVTARIKATHFASVNEIRYCILSIFKFASFIRNIFIVTDGQDPNIYDDVKRHFPERINSIRIVDHTEILRGYEEYLPTFNSITIGNMVWRIEGLSENFVYFNDDIILIRKIRPEEWVKNGRPVVRGRWAIAPYKKLFMNFIRRVLRKYLFKKTKNREKFSFFLVQWNAAKIAGMKFRYIINGHTPHVMNKTRLEQFFRQNVGLLRINLQHRFRNQDQFNVSTLSNHLEYIAGNKNIQPFHLGYLNPAYHKEKRFNRKIKRCVKDPRVKSVCIQNLDLVSVEDQASMFAWLDTFLGFENSNSGERTSTGSL